MKQGKYGATAGFCEELIGKSASVLRPIAEENHIEAITCVPSLRSDIVPAFAKQLAEKLNLPFVILLTKQGNRPQKNMKNSTEVHTMPSYQKLVRDRIPEIIEAAGKKPVTHILDEAAYLAEPTSA